MIRIIFVDDEPNILQGLQRMLRSMRQEWEMQFAGSGQEALAAMEGAPFDVIVSDMRMPGMSGLQLLSEVRKRYPATARIILSGQAEREQILQLAGNTHQYLSKPCEESSLKDAIYRSCAMRDLLDSPQLRRVVSQAQSLPSLPRLYTEIVDAVQSSEMSLSAIGELISQDMAISSKILQLINSAFFGTPRRISNVGEAVSILGIETIKSLVLTEGVFSTFPKDKVGCLGIDALWQHSAGTASIARSLAKEERLPVNVCQEAFTAAFLHDVGKLILALNMPDDYAEAIALAETEGQMDWEAETAVLGASHAEVGAYLLSLWGLPATMIDAIAWHHRPEAYPNKGLGAVALVHIANALEHSGGVGRESRLASAIDESYLSALNRGDRFLHWQKTICKAAA
jgi:putative nucleotidyltransferase with HDIG domain